VADQDLDEFIESYRQALQAMVSGAPAAVLSLFSSRDDVTLANPLGPPCRGRAAVEEATKIAAASLQRAL
jgi:hypothetical protein